MVLLWNYKVSAEGDKTTTTTTARTQLIEMNVLETAEDDMESRIFTSGGGLNLNSTTLTLLGRIILCDKLN